MKLYRIKQVWQTVQGEGFYAGTLSVFVRFVGCNMWSGYEADRARDAARNGAGCPMWCDTDFTKEGSRLMTRADVMETIRETAGLARHVVLTGGEPFLSADGDLIHAMEDHGYHVAVETNGTCSIADSFGHNPPHFITCSPKQPEDLLRLELCHEIKLVVPDYRPADFPRLSASAGHRWVQPEDGPRFAAAVAAAYDHISADPSWRISVQGHKALQLP